jgi:MFS family permease
MAETQLTSAAPDERAGVWAAGRRWLTIGLVLTIAGAAFEALAVATIMPATVAELGGLGLYGWAFSAFMLANLVGITIAGGAADRQGPAGPFVTGVALFTLGLAVAGLAPSMPAVIVGRAIQGLGGGFVSSVAYVAIGRGYPEAARPQMLAIISSAWVVPGLIGPALSGLVAETVGWRWVFLGLAPLMPLAALFAWPALRRIGGSPQGGPQWRRVAMAVALALGVGLAQTGLGPLPRPLAALLLVAGAAVALAALLQLLPAGSLTARRGLPAAVATAGLLNLAFFGVDAFIPLALVTIRGQTAAMAGLALTAATITWTTGSWVQARLAARVRRSHMVSTGLLLVALGVLVVTGALAPAVPALLATAGWAIAGLGIGLAFSTLSLVALESAQPGQEGGAAAAIQLANQLGVSIGTAVGGAIVGAFGEQAVGAALLIQFLLMAAVAAGAILTALRIGGRQGGVRREA